MRGRLRGHHLLRDVGRAYDMLLGVLVLGQRIDEDGTVGRQALDVFAGDSKGQDETSSASGRSFRPPAELENANVGLKVAIRMLGWSVRAVHLEWLLHAVEVIRPEDVVVHGVRGVETGRQATVEDAHDGRKQLTGVTDAVSTA